jgi:hypothetical protein
MPDEYTCIQIRIRRQDEGSEVYTVEAELDDGSFFHGSELRLDRQALLVADRDPEEYGLELFYALFSGPVRRAYDLATGRAEAKTEGRLRVRLWIDDSAAELHALPWERLYHMHRGQTLPLSTSKLTPFSRYTGLPIPDPQPITMRPIRMLVAISNPRDLPPGLSPIDVEREIENLRQALGDLLRGEQIGVTLMPGRSGLSSELRIRLEDEGYQIHDGITGLENILRMSTDCHVFHFLGHGHFKRQGDHGRGTAVLYLEGEDGRWEVIKDDDLVPRLGASDPLPHLIFLAACESAKRDANTEHPFVGLAPRLVEIGVPAIVAMQDVVPMALARQLTGDFYRHLLEHGLVDLALNQARLLLFERQETDWAIPVLLTRLKEGRLFSADPVRLALQAIRAHKPYHPWSEKEYLPIEVVHLSGRQIPAGIKRLPLEPAPSFDMIDAIFDLFAKRRIQKPTPDQEQRRHRPERMLVAIVGDHGTAKSTQLRRIAWITADRSLRSDAEHLTLPVYMDLLDLQRYPLGRSGLGNSLETLMLESLKPFWPDLTADKVSDLLRSDTGPVLRLLFDGSDDLPERERILAWDALQGMARTYPRHEYVLAVDPDNLDARQLETTDRLIIQPISQRKIEQYLKGLGDPTSRRLYGALSRAQLFDLAGYAWLLVNMLNQAREGLYPQSRTTVLQNLVADAIANIPSEYGMRSRAEQTLHALAWEMQSTYSSVWPVSDAFHLFAAKRGNREYSLEGLYGALIDQGLLTRVGQESMRFAYPAIQAYCCAQAILEEEHQTQTIDNITATLGRLTRLRWWEDMLVLLSGLMDDPNALISKILYGVAFTGGEQAFLAARCLLESGNQRIDPDLIDQVVNALVWRLDSTNERLMSRRIRAAHVLGQLGRLRQARSSSIIPHLIRTANQKIRLDWRGELDYDYTSVRMAAAIALQRVMPIARGEIETTDAQLAELLFLWEKGDVEALAQSLHSEDVGAQAIAAFALGDLQTPQTVDLLVAAFLNPDSSSYTRWAASDALALLDPHEVTERAILPLLDAEAFERTDLDPRVWKRRADWYERLAYLIGKVRTPEPIAREFLDRCLYEFRGIWAKAQAIQSLGWLHDQGYKDLFERVAIGDFDDIPLREHPTSEEIVYLRRTAIEALANIGDRDTLERLRTNRTDWCPELEQAYYWTSEEIYWRLSRTDS